MAGQETTIGIKLKIDKTDLDSLQNSVGGAMGTGPMGSNAPGSRGGSAGVSNPRPASRAGEKDTSPAGIMKDIATKRIAREEELKNLNVVAAAQRKSAEDNKKAILEQLRIQKNFAGELHEQAKIQEKINQLKKEGNIISQNEAETKKRIDKITPPKTGTIAKIGSAMEGGGITSATGTASALGMGAMAMGTVGTIVAGVMAAEGIRTLIQEAGSRGRAAEAAAFSTKGQGGQRLESFMSGGAQSDFSFEKQRLQGDVLGTEKFRNRVGSWARPLMNPVETFNRIFQNSDYVEKKREEERVNLVAEETENVKNSKEEKASTLTKDWYAQNWQKNLAMKRQLGTTDSQWNKMISGAQGAGFSDQQALESSSAILGAGGSSRAAAGNSAFALQMGRSFGLTNAAQDLGKISGQMGSAEASKETLIKIQAEGVRRGFDQTGFAEENRKFVEMASSVIGQSSATTGGEVDTILSGLSKFMGGEKTLSGIQAGKSAYDAYQAMSNSQSGPNAQLRASNMRSDPLLAQLSQVERSALSLMKDEQLTYRDPRIQSMAENLVKKEGKVTNEKNIDLKSQEIVNQTKNAIKKSEFVGVEVDKAIADLKKTMHGEKYNEKDPNQRLAMGRAMTTGSLQGIAAGMDRKKLERLMEAAATGDASAMEKLEGFGKTEKKSKRGGKHIEEGSERLEAESSRLATGMFHAIHASIVPAAEQTAIFAEKVNALTAALKSGNASDITKASEAFSRSGRQAPSTQPRVGVSSQNALDEARSAGVRAMYPDG